MFAMATQQRGISTRVGNVIHGTRGTAHVDRGSATIGGREAMGLRRARGSSGDLEMHGALIRSIREGKPINEGVRLAEATMTGVMGPHERVHRPRLEVGLGDERLEARSPSAPVRDGSPAGRAGGHAGADAARLTARFAPPLFPVRWKFVTKTTVAIIGAASSGLSAAYALHKRQVPTSCWRRGRASGVIRPRPGTASCSRAAGLDARPEARGDRPLP